MLVQLLGKHGIPAKLIQHYEVSRRRIETLDTDGIAMACICYLDPAASLASLRYLAQRLRQRLPKETPLLVGLWPSDDTALKDDEIKGRIGADYFAGSLADTINACADTAHHAGDAREQPV
jgi:hypothetical protein